MPHLEASTTINAPVEKVFAYLADLTRHHEWASHPLEVAQTADGPVGEGTTFRSEARMMGRHVADIRITEFLPGERLAYEARDNTGHFRHQFVMRGNSDGTTILTKMTDQIGGSFVNRVLFGVLGRFVGTGVIRRDVARIKERVEAGG